MRWASLSESVGAWGRQEVVLHSSCFDLICLILLTEGTRGSSHPFCFLCYSAGPCKSKNLCQKQFSKVPPTINVFLSHMWERAERKGFGIYNNHRAWDQSERRTKASTVQARGVSGRTAAFPREPVHCQSGGLALSWPHPTLLCLGLPTKCMYFSLPRLYSAEASQTHQG